MSAENVLRGERLSPDSIAAAAQVAASECDPPTNAHGSARYRRKMLEVFLSLGMVGEEVLLVFVCPPNLCFGVRFGLLALIPSLANFSLLIDRPPDPFGSRGSSFILTPILHATALAMAAPSSCPSHWSGWMAFPTSATVKYFFRSILPVSLSTPTSTPPMPISQKSGLKGLLGVSLFPLP